MRTSGLSILFLWGMGFPLGGEIVMGQRLADAYNVDPIEIYTTRAIACDNERFTATIAGGFLSNSPFIRLDKTPQTYTAFERQYYEDVDNDTFPQFRYKAVFKNIRHWRGKVCLRKVAGPSTDPVSMLLGFYVKTRSGDFRPIKDNGKEAFYTFRNQGQWTYSWSGSWSEPTDFMIGIFGADPNDQFDIMMDKKP